MITTLKMKNWNPFWLVTYRINLIKPTMFRLRLIDAGATHDKQQPITEQFYFAAWPMTPYQHNWPITDGFTSPLWPSVSWIDYFKVPTSGTLGQAAGATGVGHALKQSMSWSSRCAKKMQHSQKMSWPGIKFTDFSRVLDKLIKFLDLSRAGKHFFWFPGLFPNSRTAGNPAYKTVLMAQIRASSLCLISLHLTAFSAALVI